MLVGYDTVYDVMSVFLFDQAWPLSSQSSQSPLTFTTESARTQCLENKMSPNLDLCNMMKRRNFNRYP